MKKRGAYSERGAYFNIYFYTTDEKDPEMKARLRERVR